MKKSSNSESKTEIYSGSYQIYLYLSKPVSVSIGSLGEKSFKSGLYVYTGSAMKNLSQRIERHKKRLKKKRWHIDYLTADRNFRIVRIDVFPSKVREECSRNLEILKVQKGTVPIPGFGSSDCKSCPTHLVYLDDNTI